MCNNININLTMQFTGDRFRNGNEKEKDAANTDLNKEVTAKCHNFQNYSKEL